MHNKPLICIDGGILLYKKREFITGAAYHVTSRTNDKIRIFENKLGRKIMLMTLQNAKDKFRFRLVNFCLMPTHIHLLIIPDNRSSLSVIMHWIKVNSAKRWNRIHGSTDHLWGNRYFARAIKDAQEYNFIMTYIDQNPVTAGLSPTPEEWKASGAYYKARNIQGLVDYSPFERQNYIKLLSPVPPIVSKIIPPVQLEHILQYFDAYSDEIDQLYKLVPTIPKLGESSFLKTPSICLHYHTGTADYFIYEYDNIDTMYGLVRFIVYPAESKYKKFSLSELKSNQHMKLDLSWSVTSTVVA